MFTLILTLFTTILQIGVLIWSLLHPVDRGVLSCPSGKEILFVVGD